ncbi:hypothetical protein BKA67DRAFT_533674 [Truncatella angustata]|uniref:Uncharacterized protein n=1 Tax=Truncatella angustata TaxID=152316 RepID=A0A9P8UUM0_9PEZI|nr:uncharacterized protein BKA67DRAFT_533674 [Truncatella angustata]KAH6658523.1 hypothetical protein BKA67DRAFT_533674 [Truncatella angustata]
MQTIGCAVGFRLHLHPVSARSAVVCMCRVVARLVIYGCGAAYQVSSLNGLTGIVFSGERCLMPKTSWGAILGRGPFRNKYRTTADDWPTGLRKNGSSPGSPAGRSWARRLLIKLKVRPRLGGQTRGTRRARNFMVIEE